MPGDQTYNNSIDAANATSWLRLPYRGVQHQFQPGRHSPAAFHHGTCGGPPRAHRPCRRFTPFDYCRSPVRSPATFTAPFCVRSDPDEDDLFIPSVPPSLHGVRRQSRSLGRNVNPWRRVRRPSLSRSSWIFFSMWFALRLFPKPGWHDQIVRTGFATHQLRPPALPRGRQAADQPAKT